MLETDWLDLWRELTVATSHSPNSELIKRFKDHAKKQSERPDPLLDFVLKQLDSHTTVLDIGAGSGRWTVPLAKIARIVTAVEPSGAMRDMLIENIASAKLKNVQIVQTSWEEATVESHFL